MKTAVLLLLLIGVAVLAYIRLAPSDPDRWHVDPTRADPPGTTGVLYLPDGKNSASVYPLPFEELSAAFDTFALAQPRVTRLAGSAREGRFTYIARSKWLGFPDYVTVEAIALGPDRSTLAILSRQRLGTSDLGVNRDRIDAWLQAFQPVEQ